MASEASKAKDEGNAFLSSGAYDKAVASYTRAIELDGSNHVFYSNRSAALCKLNKYQEALADAEKCISIKPDWGKGYGRKATALHFLGNLEAAMQAYEAGLKVEPTNASLKEGLESLMGETRGQGMQQIAKLLGGDFLVKCTMDPTLRQYAAQDDFVQKIKQIQANPETLQLHMQDKRIAEALNFALANAMGQSYRPSPASAASDSSAAARVPEPEPEPEPMEEDSDDRKKALEHKANGNRLYKEKKFDEAIAEYQAAIEADSTDVSFRTNICAALFEKKDYEKCIEEAKKAIEVGKEQRCDLKLIARAYQRIGNAKRKMGDLDGAIEAYNKSLLEHKERAVVLALQSTEKQKRKEEEEAYINPELALEEKNKGNAFFKEGNFVDAVKHYSESIKRNPKDHVPYSNRAAAYTKLGAFPDALRDCEKCIDIEPSFVKAWSRKGNLHFFMKEYQKSIEAFRKGLSYDPNHQDCRDGLSKVMMTVQMSAGSRDEDRIRQAQADPEIRNILNDSMIQEVLRSIQDNPKSLQDYLKDPQIAAALEKLMAAGILG